jgi:Mg-chelatase subunit ChlD
MMKRIGFLALTTASVLLSGCVVENSDETVTKYNELVERFNFLIQNGVEKDTILIKTQDELEAIGADYEKQAELRQRITGFLNAGDCTSASPLVDKQYRSANSALQTKISTLMQGSWNQAFKVIRKGIAENYNDLGEASMELRLTLNEMTQPHALTGMKKDLEFSFNQMVELYNKACTTPSTRAVTPAAAVAPTPKADPTKIVVADGSGKTKSVDRESMKKEYSGAFSEGAFNQFAALADASGGNFAYSSSSAQLPTIIDGIFASIEKRSEYRLDVAIVLDVTSSMKDDIEAVKTNLLALKKRLEVLKDRKDLQVGIVLYADRGDPFIADIFLQMTSDLAAFERSVKAVRLYDGGDVDEAVADAIDLAQRDLRWRSGAGKSLILIGDAPGHSHTVGSGPARSLTEITKKLKDMPADLLIYPILVNQ